MTDLPSMTAQDHVLKTRPNYFDAVARGEKNFEVRRDDRGFQRGDIVALRRYNPQSGCMMAPYEPLRKRITYVLTGGQFGIEPGYVVLGLGDITDA